MCFKFIWAKKNNIFPVEVEERVSPGPVCDKDNEPLECSICLQSLAKETTTMLECGHIFHSTCHSKWQAFANTCPVCRNAAKEHPLMKDFRSLLAVMTETRAISHDDATNQLQTMHGFLSGRVDYAQMRAMCGWQTICGIVSTTDHDDWLRNIVT